MPQFNDYVARRHVIANTYDKELASLPIITPFQAELSRSAYHLYIIRLNLDAIAPLTHLQVFQAMRERGISVNIHYIPVHTQPYYREMGFDWGDFPNSEAYYRSALSIPMFPRLSDQEQTEVIESLHEILN